VVIAIIAILASLLLPALGGARQRAWTIECLSNKRQLMAAWNMYADDHQERLVLNVPGSYWEYFLPPSWVRGEIGWAIGRGVSTNIECLRDDSALLAPYFARQVKLLKCPADRYLSPEQRAAGWTARVRSVSMNYFMGDGWGTISLGSYKRPIEASGRLVYRWTHQMRETPPWKAWVIIDEHPDSIRDATFGVDVETPSWLASSPANYHSRASTLGFADGHAELRKWPSPEDAPVRYDGTRWFPTDPRDLQWLVERTTELQ
jgi:prepilin-type processing-associated H-X9-DG protein